MVVVSDMSEKEYLPIPDDMLVNLSDSYDIISNLLDNFHLYFQDQSYSGPENSMIHSLHSSFNIAKHIGGRILFFQSSQNSQRLPELQVNPQSAKEIHAKFSPSSTQL